VASKFSVHVFLTKSQWPSIFVGYAQTGLNPDQSARAQEAMPKYRKSTKIPPHDAANPG
jgi:hypothetical protein